ncbi:MAG: DUF4465 domain-containing protein, partial [Bacteroidota bacterium]
RNDSTEGYLNMYSAITAKGYQSNNYAVGQDGAKVTIPASKNVHGVYVTNSTYAFLSMKKGDQFAKKFGGVSGNDADSFELIVKGYHNGALKNTSVHFKLADFTFSNNAQDYTVNQWTWLDLTALNDADSLVFGLESSDVGSFGMNTPAYFCIDNFTVTDTGLAQTITAASFEEIQLELDAYWNGQPKSPITFYASGNARFNNNYNTGFDYWSSGFALSNVIDTTTSGYTNMYASVAGKGYNSQNYAIATGGAKVVLTGAAAGKAVDGFYITNNTYAYLSMKNGDQFAKKFGGIAGSDPDYFEVVIKGHKGGTIKDSVIAVLADFRSNNSSEDYILKTWKWVDLLPLGDIDSLSFSFRSSDVGQFGMNTPGYFCMDNFTTKDAPAVPTLTTGNVDPLICAGKTFNLAFTTTLNFNAGNVFNAQLSDSSGNFGTPVTVGTLSGVAGGSIAVTLPSNLKGGAYKLRVIASNPNTEGAASNTFMIGTKPVIASITGDSVVKQNTTTTHRVDSNAGSTYVWAFTNGTGTSVTSKISIQWTTAGTATLKVVETSAQGCVSDTASKNIIVDLAIGLNSIAGTLEASVYPNPVSSVLKVQLPAGLNECAISVYDITGKQVMKTANTQEINVSSLDRGIYMIAIEADGKSTVKRIIVE